MGELILSKRLQTLASHVKKGAFIADIGSDHAYLPTYICLHDPSAKAIAGEVNKGPYLRAKSTVEAFRLDKQIDVRLGDGLTILTPTDKVTLLTISGMGGGLIRHIIGEGDEKIPYVQRMILQPNTDANQVRDWLSRNNFLIVEEDIIEEKGHLYEYIVADKTIENCTYLTKKQQLLGPLLLKKKSEHFCTKWKYEQQKRQRILSQMRKAKYQDFKKIEHIELELQWIKEAMTNGN
ncbi:tRNA (adenine(22)-N(1))-methyltransferase [Virgibacillus sp. W0430]|uniref:tRNA (adenine(22)-N(1))-methyltransferase n=1 Tax=Virgibacillus sp. W0430 TaxID=3391580 RepID=UPI003F471E34